MAEMAKKLHFLKNGTEQTAKAYSTTDEVGELYAFTKIDGIDCYVPLTTKKYYKKVAWVQPTLTSNTSHGTLTTNSTSTSTEHSAWKAFDGNSDTWFETNKNQTSAYLNWNFGEEFYVTGITVKSRTGDRPNLTIRAYTDKTMGTPIGDALAFTTAGQTQSVTNIPADGRLIDNIYFDCTSTQDYLGVCEITITGYVITESTKDDYDIEEWVNATNGRVIKTLYVKKVMVDEIWQQPVLSANGTMGGSEFACSASATNTESAGTATDAWGVFDNNTDTYWRSGTTSGWIQFYNPVPLKVSAIKWGYFYSYPTGGNVQGSNDGTTWTTLNTWTNSSGADFTINLSTQQYYKYYRINVTGVNKDVIHVHSLTITATYQKEVETYVGKHDDYDYSITETYAILATGTPPYAKKQWTTAGTYTFTVPARVTRIRATCVGGGGAGTARSTNANTANGEDSSFGSVVAKGGNSCRLNNRTVVQYPYGGSPNGRSGGLWCRSGAFTATDAAGNEYQVNDTTKDVYRAGGKGFALSTSKADGDYGRGGQVYNWDYYCTYGSGGSGGWNQQTIAVTPNTTITVKVGARANYASGDADGVNASESNQARGGFVIIEYGQGV